MSWIGSSDTTSQIRLKFETKEEATNYARTNNLLFFIDVGSERRMNIEKMATVITLITTERGHGPTSYNCESLVSFF